MRSASGPDTQWIGLPLITALAVCCGFPTDQGGEVFVTIDAPVATVVRGQTLVLTGTTWQQRSDGGPVRLVGATLDWSPDDSSIAAVIPRRDGSALITGVNRGLLRVRAVPRDYENARPGTVDIRVTNTVEIDVVEPDTVRYGGQLTIHGVGLGRVASVSLGETRLIPDTASFSGDPAGAGSQRFWVPYPAFTDRVLARAEEGFSAPAAEQTIVVPRTVYFTEARTPAVVQLDNTGVAGRVLFYNPALAVTAEGGGNVLRLVAADSARPVTITVSTTAPVVTGMIPSVSPAVSGPFDFWSIGTSRQHCGTDGEAVTTRGLEVGALPAVITRSFQHTPAEGLLLAVSGESPGRFAVTVTDGYRGSDPRIEPDRFEENDTCVAADVNALDPARQVDPLGGFADTLTIDQPYEVDWFRFTIPGDPFDEDPPPLPLVTARVTARPFGAADPSDLTLTLIDVNDLQFGGVVPDVTPWLAESHGAGSSESISAELEPGDYYLIVGDDGGVATRYALCLGIGTECILPSASLRSGSGRLLPNPTQSPERATTSGSGPSRR
jgi:hypothetical protein